MTEAACPFDDGPHYWMTIGYSDLQCAICGVMSEDPDDTDARV